MTNYHDLIRENANYKELANQITSYSKQFKTVLEIPIYGSERHLCSCDEIATREVIYERTSRYEGKPFTKRFREMICDECFNETGYLTGKRIIKISKVEICELCGKTVDECLCDDIHN